MLSAKDEFTRMNGQFVTEKVMKMIKRINAHLTPPITIDINHI